MRKENKLKKSLIALCAVAAISVATVGVSVPVKAEVTYGTSVSYFTPLDGSTVNTYLSRTGHTIHSSYKGIWSEVTPAEGTNDFEIAFNGTVFPERHIIIAQEWGFSPIDTGVTPAKAVVYSWRSIQDNSKVVNVIATDRNGGWGNTYLSLTDDYVVADDGAVTIAGTQQSVVGMKRETGEYNAWGWTAGASKQRQNGLQFNSDNWVSIQTNGDVKLNNTTVMGNIANEDFLAKSKANLSADSEYAKLYTSEYVSNLLTEFQNGTIFSIKAIDMVETASYSFTIRQIDGKWIGDNGGVAIPRGNAKPYPVKTTETLYVGETYHVNDLIEERSIYRDADGNQVTYSVGFYGATSDSWAASGAWFDGSVQDKTFTATTVGKYNILTYSYDFKGGSYGNQYLLSYNVVEKPTVSFGDTKFTCKLGEVVTAPVAENTVDGAFAGWVNDSGDFVAPGAKITVEGSETYTAKYIDFAVVEGASIRLSTPYGIRFTTKLAASASQFMAQSGAQLKSIVTKITSVGSDKSVDIVIDRTKAYTDEETNCICFNAALVNIREENLTRVYYATTYMTVADAEGNEWTIVSTVESEGGRSYAEVLKAAKEDIEDGVHEYSTDEVEIINTLYASVISEETAATVSFEIVAIVDGKEVDQTAAYAEFIEAFMEGKAYKYGDTVTVDTATLPQVDGYELDETASVLEVVCGVRGAQIKIVYMPVAA